MKPFTELCKALDVIPGPLKPAEEAKMLCGFTVALLERIQPYARNPETVQNVIDRYKEWDLTGIEPEPLLEDDRNFVFDLKGSEPADSVHRAAHAAAFGLMEGAVKSADKAAAF